MGKDSQVFVGIMLVYRSPLLLNLISRSFTDRVTVHLCHHDSLELCDVLSRAMNQKTIEYDMNWCALEKVLDIVDMCPRVGEIAAE